MHLFTVFTEHILHAAGTRRA